MTLPLFLRSRKFWAAVIAVAVIVMRSYLPAFPLSDEAVSNLILTLVAYIVGTGLSDIRIQSSK